MAHRESVLAFLRARIRSGADAEDIYQQALLRPRCGLAARTTHPSERRSPRRERPFDAGGPGRTELEELAANALGAPPRVLCRHLSNQSRTRGQGHLREAQQGFESVLPW